MSLYDNEFYKCDWCLIRTHAEESVYCDCHNDKAFCSNDCLNRHIQDEIDKEDEFKNEPRLDK